MLQPELLFATPLLALGMLPSSLSPPAPFPLIVAQSTSNAIVAPGILLGRYNVMTNVGPLVVRTVAVNTREPNVRIASVLAHDRLVSPGETVSSMAARTGAVAGINADYFDIGQTNQPLGIVVQDGRLVRTPSGRATMTIARDGTVRFGTYRFAGTATAGSRTWPVGGVDEWPPQAAGTALMLPAFGPLPALPGGAIAWLTAAGPTSATGGGSYRVAALGAKPAGRPAGLALAFAPGAVAAGLPDPGDEVEIDASTDPALDDVAAALGGGPLLVSQGTAFTDPNPPSPAEALQHDPQVGALRRDDGEVVFVAVDGRFADYSTGLTRPEFGALMLGLGAADGIGFDSGGSATLVARSPGDAAATVQNRPSDGVERPVADAFLVYSDAPRGPPARLAVRPDPIVVVAGARVATSAVVTDAAGHPLSSVAPETLSLSVAPAALARTTGASLAAVAPGSGTVRVRGASLAADVPIRVVGAVSRLRIDPARANPDRGGSVRYRALGFDAAGTPVELGETVRWSADHGAIDRFGVLRVGDVDATVNAVAGGATTSTVALVGRRQVPLALFRPPARWTFSTFPTGGTGSVVLGGPPDPPTLALTYAFEGPTRGAYAQTHIDLLGDPVGFGVDVKGDASGAGVRAAFSNSRGERVLVTVARRVDWRGWQRREVVLPPSAVPPLRLLSLYLVASLGGAPVHGSGTIAFRDFRATFAGTSTPSVPFKTADR